MISLWIRKLIHHVNKTARTHKISALVVSLAFRGSVDLKDILSACSWMPLSTFLDFYLWHTAFLREGLHHLGHIVAAQHSIMLQDYQ